MPMSTLLLKLLPLQLQSLLTLVLEDYSGSQSHGLLNLVKELALERPTLPTVSVPKLHHSLSVSLCSFDTLLFFGSLRNFFFFF